MYRLKSGLQIIKTNTKCVFTVDLITQLFRFYLHFKAFLNRAFCFIFLFSPIPLVVSEQTDGQEETLSQQQARMSASSATRELDELMASLSDFKVQSNVS